MKTALEIVLELHDKVTAPLKKSLSSIEKTTTSLDLKMHKMSSTVKALGAAFGAFQALALAKDVVQLADKYTLLENKLKLVTTSADNLAQVQDRLYNLTIDTHSAYDATVTLYSRFARATEDAGVSQEDLLTVTRAVNEAVKVSGATAQEAEAAIIQLSQGMASGTLRGEELNSVLEQTPRIAQMIADGLGITIGQLRQYGKEGKLTTEQVIKALKDQASTVHSEFTSMSVTVGQAWQDVKTVFEGIITDGTDAASVTDTLAGGFEDLAGYLNEHREDIKFFFEGAVEAARNLGEAFVWTLERMRELDEFLSGKTSKSSEDIWAEQQVAKIEALAMAIDELERSNTPGKEQYLEKMRERLKLLTDTMDVFMAAHAPVIEQEKTLDQALSKTTTTAGTTSESVKKLADDQCKAAKKALSCAEKQAKEQERIGREMMAAAVKENNYTQELIDGIAEVHKKTDDAILADLEQTMSDHKELWEGETEEVSQLNELLVNDLGRIFDDYISDILHGQIDDIGDLFEGLFDSIVDMFLRMVAQMAANSLVEAIFGSGSSGGITLGGAIGSLFGGGSGGGGAIGTGASLVSGASTVSGWFGGPTIGGALSSAAGSLGLGGQTVVAPYVAGGAYQTLGSAGVTTAAASASASATSAAVADGVATGMSNWAADAAALNAAESSMLASSGSTASAGAGASMGASAGSVFGAVGTAGFFVLPIMKSLGVFDDGLQLYTHDLESLTGRILTLTTVAESQAAADARFADPAWVKAQLGMVEGYGANAVGNNTFVSGQGYVNTPLADSVAGAYQARLTDTHRMAADTEYGSEAAAGVEKIADDLYMKLHDVYTALEIDATQYGDTLANTALHMADSLPAFDAYVDAVTGVDVSLGDSTSMMQMASQAADGNSSAFFNLVSALEAQGMSTQAATETASEMASVMYTMGDAALASAGAMASAASTIGNAASLSAEWQSKAAAMAAAPQYGYHAAGGIMTRPTVFHVGGEAGAEAIAPLHDGPDTLKKMHQDILASKNVNVQVFIGNQEFKKDFLVLVDEHVAARNQAGLTTERVAY